MKRDHAFLIELLDTFTSNRVFRQKLKIIDKQNIRGWETWLQIEFSYFLTELEDNIEWYRELRCLPDKRYAAMKNRCSIIPDFVVRKKGWSQNYFLFIEFKQNASPSDCIKNMFLDLKKILSIRKNENIDVRSYWCVGFTRSKDIQELKEKILKYNDDCYDGYYDIEQYLTIKRIGRTPYSTITF
ncbi:MAG: hypothetical protein J6563_00700 [Gilliamella sp.]|uniref:hypothetical protein n=1 Tax=unclassified Gilliamella TaxID=2685620 RepID=UPI00080D9193|nr:MULTISPECIES: hypothetical protein [Gilliamella]MCO6551480.1 hypothetical protein [Gilliamella sp.]OCG35615.1 hypothetical protein A9G31_07835 [Gilliamella apicola]OCG68011.1 hypothetical protein A9G39_03545 [Gilliamella apicola]